MKKDYIADGCRLWQLASNRAIRQFFPSVQVWEVVLTLSARIFTVSPSDNWDELSYKVAVQYFPNDDVMLYGSVTTGYKAGGFAGSQGVELSASEPVNPETAINYELGFKGDLFR